MSAEAARSTAGFEPLLTARARSGLGAPAFRWLLAPSAAAWLILLFLSAFDHSLALCVAPRASLLEGFFANVVAGFAAITPGRWAAEWALMIVAMMFPLLVPMVRHVAARNFAARRERSVGLFIASYALVWLAAAAASSVALVAARSALQAIDLAAWTGLICCALAAGWQLSAAKVRAVNRCHGTVPLRPWTPHAGRDAIGFGLLHGTRCVRACLPVMVLPLAGGHGLAAMAAVFAILLAERARPRPQYRLSAIILVLLGLMTVAVHGFG
jgi:predicted metal-binding membrane protein